jgi:hypothetical protein
LTLYRRSYYSSVTQQCDLFTFFALSGSYFSERMLQVVLGEQLKKTIFGGFFSIAVGYGLALMVGILVAGGAR